MPDLVDRTVLVVGGARALGRRISERLADAGANVIIAARNLEKAAQVAEALPRATALQVDITDEASVRTAAASVDEIDHIVTLASSYHDVPIAEIDPDSVAESLKAKVIGPMLLAKHFGARIASGGSMVMFSGLVAWKPGPRYTVLGVTNGAVSFLAAHLAYEMAPIRVNAIAPGVIDSGVWDDLPAAERQSLFDQTTQSVLAGRVGTNDEVADALLWLLSAGFVTGETVHIDGGARIS